MTTMTEDTSYYLEGMCHVLALALAEETGTLLRVLKGWQGEEIIVHVAVEHPDLRDTVIDVLGARSEREVVEAYADVAELWWEDALREDIDALVDEYRLHRYSSEECDRARTVAKSIFNGLGLDVGLRPPPRMLR